MTADLKLDKRNSRQEVSFNSVSKLPFEDTVWAVENSEQRNEDDIVERVWTIFDSDRTLIGARAFQLSESEEECVSSLLFQSITNPFSFKPRRPKYITLNNDGAHGVSPEVFTKFGIHLIESVHARLTPAHKDLTGPATHSAMQSCSVCQKRGTTELFITCEKCQALYYCSYQCLIMDSEGKEDTNHMMWCEKMKFYMKQTAELADMPFTFTARTTAVDFDERAYREFQTELGVYGRGLWRRESPHQHSLPQYGLLQLKDADHNDFVLDDLNRIYRSSRMEEPGSKQTENLPPKLLCWDDYYKWKGLELSSPVAILMQWPLTLYYILNALMEQHYPQCEDQHVSDEVIKIHVIGAEKEVDILPVFYELEKLMPHKSFELLIVGRQLSKKCHQKVFSSKKTSIRIEKGLYHSTARPKPHLVIGFNAGLGAYPSWVDTLKCLKDMRVPAYFTDYCQYSCECSRSPIQALQLGDISQVYINPFRSPVRKYSEGNAFPWYSNGFLFCLMYSDSK